MRGRIIGLVSGMLAVGALSMGNAYADTTWNTAACPISGCTASAGGSLTFTSGGQTIKAAGFDATATTTSASTQLSNKLNTDALEVYSGNGLGVGPDVYPTHAVDNQPTSRGYAHSDAVIFQLPTNYQLVGIQLNSFGSSYPNDVTIIVGNAAAATKAGISSLSSFSNLSISTLLNDGFQQLAYQGQGTKNESSDTFGNTNTNGGTVTETLTTPVDAQYVLVLAALQPATNKTDYFKVAAITGRQGSTTKVPEPASLALFLGGAIGLYSVRRRRAQGEPPAA